MGRKLIRDKVPLLPWRDESAKAGLSRVKDDVDFVRLLRQKLLEEVGELIAAADDVEIVNEAADVVEALHAYVWQAARALPYEIDLVRDGKRKERGGFDVGIVWET